MGDVKKAGSGKPSPKARRTTARLQAVQAVYQSLQNEVSPVSLYQEYVEHRRGMDMDGEKMIECDAELFRLILSGVTERWGDLQQIIKPRVEKTGNLANLLAAILICGGYELLVHQDIDKPIIINDYLNITGDFYTGNEPKLINGILDDIAKEVRN